MISKTHPGLLQISPRAISFLDPFKTGKPSNFYYQGSTAAQPYFYGYTFHNEDLEVFSLFRFGNSSHLYFSVKPAPVIPSNPLTIFRGLYWTVDGVIVAYNPTQPLLGQTIDHRLYLNSQNGFIYTGLYARGTHITYASNFDLNKIPSKTGVIYALNKTGPEINTLINSLPRNTEALNAMNRITAGNELGRRTWKPMFDDQYVADMKAAFERARNS